MLEPKIVRELMKGETRVSVILEPKTVREMMVGEKRVSVFGAITNVVAVLMFYATIIGGFRLKFKVLDLQT